MESEYFSVVNIGHSLSGDVGGTGETVNLLAKQVGEGDDGVKLV